MTPHEFRDILPHICSTETSFTPDEWTPRNPLWGHCAVVALLANDYFGGRFVRASLVGTPFSAAGSHYWNVFPDGTEYDFTREQFGDAELQLVGTRNHSPGKPIHRDDLLRHPDTKKRYELLRARFESYLLRTS